MAGVHVIIIGGVSVNDPRPFPTKPEGPGNYPHDRFPYNFINPGMKRAIAFGSDAHVIFFTPPYEYRAQNQKAEHSKVTVGMVDSCGLPLPFGYCAWDTKIKNPNHFLNFVTGPAAKQGIGVTTIRTGAELTKALKGFAEIESIHYFGHSNATRFFLQYSVLVASKGEVFWDDTDAVDISALQFTPTATFATYGCNQGEAGGLAESLRKRWKIRTIGSEGRTNYEPIGQNEAFPLSDGGFYEYPKPTFSGLSWSFPARVPTTAW